MFAFYFEFFPYLAQVQRNRVKEHLGGSAAVHMNFIVAFAISLDFNEDRRENAGCFLQPKINPFYNRKLTHLIKIITPNFDHVTLYQDSGYSEPWYGRVEKPPGASPLGHTTALNNHYPDTG